MGTSPEDDEDEESSESEFEPSIQPRTTTTAEGGGEGGLGKDETGMVGALEMGWDEGGGGRIFSSEGGGGSEPRSASTLATAFSIAAIKDMVNNFLVKIIWI